VIIAVDFDATVVRQDRSYDDVVSPLTFEEGAEVGLRALKRAGHVLLLWSARANRALREDPGLDPLVAAGVVRVDRVRWERMRPINVARYQQMIAFVKSELDGVFDAIDGGLQGKPCADLFIDDRAMRFGAGANGMTWRTLAYVYGELDLGPPVGSQPRASPAER